MINFFFSFWKSCSDPSNTLFVQIVCPIGGHDQTVVSIISPSIADRLRCNVINEAVQVLYYQMVLTGSHHFVQIAYLSYVMKLCHHHLHRHPSHYLLHSSATKQYLDQLCRLTVGGAGPREDDYKHLHIEIIYQSSSVL